MTDTLPKSRVFYRLVDGRVLASKSLLMAELLPPADQAKLGRQPFTRSQVMSRENMDPRTYAFITAYSTVVKDRESRILRVVDAVVAPPEGAAPPSFIPPESPHGDGHWVGRLVGITIGDQVIAATVVDVSLDGDLASGTKLSGVTRKFVVEIADPAPPATDAGRGDLAIVIVERATEVIKQKAEVHWITMTTEGGVISISNQQSLDGSVSKSPHLVKVKGIAAVRPWGACVATLPVDNTVNARFSTRNLPGLVSVSAVSDNHLSSAQVSRKGVVKLAVITKVENVVAADGSVQRQSVTRKWLSWSPPEAAIFGTPVDVTAATGGAECDFDLLCLFNAPDGAGGTFAKTTKLTVHVNADLLPGVDGSEDVEVQTTFRKTPDGRPIFGKTQVSPSLDLTTLPAWSLIEGHPDAPTQGAPIPNSKEVQLDGVDDQGLSVWHKRARPVFPGRTYPTAVFERWFAVPAPSDSLADQVLQKTSAVADHEFDVWMIPIPTTELIAYLQQLSLLRPVSTEPTSPDEKVYPYKEATPQNLDTDPATLMPDKVLAVLAKYLDASGNPIFPPPVDGVPWYRDPGKIYYFFAIRVGDLQDPPLVNAQRRFTGQSRFDDGPLDPPDHVVQFPVATHLSGTASLPSDAGDDAKPEVPPGLTQSLLFIYPRKFVPSKASGPGDALKSLGSSCGDQTKDPMEQADLLARVRKG